MHLYNTLIDKKEGHILDLWCDFLSLFNFNEEVAEIERLTNGFILKFKNEIQENLDQLSETQKYLYLEQLKTVFSKKLPGLKNALYEHCVSSIVEKEFPENKALESDALNIIMTNFNNKFKYVKADLATNTINTIETIPYEKYWLSVISSITDFVSFALNSVTAKNANINSQPKLSGFKKIMLPNQIESLYHQFSINPYRPVLVALDILLTEIDEITETKELITYIGNIYNPTSTLNTLGKLVSRIDIKDPETQIFFNVIQDAINNYTSFKFLMDDYTEIREFFENAYSIVWVLLMLALEKKIITLEEMRQIKVYSNDNLFELHRIAKQDSELFEHLKEHLQLLYRNIILDTCIFPLDPMLNGVFKNRNDIPIDSTDKKPIENPINNRYSTKAEIDFFKFTERVDLKSFDKNTEISAESLFYRYSESFKNEIIANVSNYSKSDREYYLNRIIKHLESLPSGDGEHKIVPINTIELDKLEINHFALDIHYGNLRHYKNDMLQFIENFNVETNYPENKNKPQTNKSIFPDKDRTLLTIKEVIFNKCSKDQEPDTIWLSRFFNDNSKLEPIFPNSKGAGRKGDEFTEAKIWQAAFIDIIKDKLKETGCIGIASKLYFITKWGIDKYDTFITNRSEKESFAKAKNQFQSLLQ